MPWPLDRLLDHGIRALWPSRLHQELLLDLGERKGWGREDYDRAVDEVASWLRDELGLPAEIEPCAPRSLDVRAWAREFGSHAGEGPAVGGVARWATALAPALGVSGKTLANSVRERLRLDRSDHRWLGALCRIASGDAPLAAWSFHARTAQGVASELGRLAVPDHLDAGDALILMSLLALWQRRRPSERARANRGEPRSRRETPKPLAALRGSLATPGQLRRLVALAPRLGADGGRALMWLAFEASLTEAHLAPHPARSTDEPSSDGEEWLKVVAELAPAHGLLHDGDLDVLRFRVSRMRTWRDKAPLADSGVGSVREPYVAASLALEAARRGEPRSRTFAPDEPGLLMLLPLLRTRNLLVTT
jgi:hypothetical protein